MSLTTQHIVRTIVIPVYIHNKTLHTLIDVAIDVTVSFFQLTMQTYYRDYCCCSLIHHTITEDQHVHVCHYMHSFLKSNGTDTLSMILVVYEGRIIFTIATAGYLHASSTFVSVSEFDITRMLTTKTCATSGRKEIENGYECRGLVFDRKRPRGFYGTHQRIW